MIGNTQKAINRVCEYRCLPKVAKGQRCEVDGKTGVIWGGNTAANFNVKMDPHGKVYNCHPNWKMKIFDFQGEIIHDSTGGE